MGTRLQDEMDRIKQNFDDGVAGGYARAKRDIVAWLTAAFPKSDDIAAAINLIGRGEADEFSGRNGTADAMKSNAKEQGRCC